MSISQCECVYSLVLVNMIRLLWKWSTKIDRQIGRIKEIKETGHDKQKVANDIDLDELLKGS